MAPPSPPSAAVDRFRDDARSLGIGEEAEPIGLAVSGGPDSLALLLLASGAFPGRVAVASVDHGLRPEASAETDLVAEICRELGVPHAVLRPRVDTDRSSLQRAAREARYAALAAWLDAEHIALLATAHHADDQAETVMMRLLKGSGIGGLAAVRARGPLPAPGSNAQLIRPLLGWRRAELRAIVDAAGLRPADDCSNHDDRFDRVRIRTQLAESHWIDPIPLARSAAALSEADEALDWMIQRLHAERVTGDKNKLFLDHRALPAEAKRRLLVMLLAEWRVGTQAPRGEDVGRLLARLEQGATATLAGVKCRGGQLWTFEPEPGRRKG